jgi:hypothetical protein
MYDGALPGPSEAVNSIRGKAGAESSATKSRRLMFSLFLADDESFIAEAGVLPVPSAEPRQLTFSPLLALPRLIK